MKPKPFWLLNHFTIPLFIEDVLSLTAYTQDSSTEGSVSSSISRFWRRGLKRARPSVTRRSGPGRSAKYRLALCGQELGRCQGRQHHASTRHPPYLNVPFSPSIAAVRAKGIYIGSSFLLPTTGYFRFQDVS